MDEAELKKAGMLITDENGKQFIDLKTSYEVLVTKVMNPGVPEGNVLANTPGYYGLEDNNNFYKNIFNDMTVKKEDMKVLGSTDVGILSDELIKAEDKFKNSKSNFGDFSVMGNTYFYKGKRLNQGEVNKLIQSGITNPKDIVAEIEKDRQKYTEFLRQPATGDTNASEGYSPPTLEEIRGTRGPGSGYQAGASYPTPEQIRGTRGPGSGYQAGATYTKSSRGVKKGTGASGPPGRNYSTPARTRATEAAQKLGTKLATRGK